VTKNPLVETVLSTFPALPLPKGTEDGEADHRFGASRPSSKRTASHSPKPSFVACSFPQLRHDLVEAPDARDIFIASSLSRR
jgi:hypothetical protein